MELILVINPGSTSTKIAMYDGENELWRESIPHTPQELSACGSDICSQLDMRRELVLKAVENHGCGIGDLACVVSRGGPISPLSSGAYLVDDEMARVIRTCPQDQHPANLGALIALEIARGVGINAYIYDAVTVDELIPEARVTGLPEMERRGQGHNLNMRAAALRWCNENGKDYKAVNLLVCHMGGGITMSLHEGGRISDMISDDEGPFSPERAGGLPVFQAVSACFAPGASEATVLRRLKRGGGLMAWFGTTDLQAVEAMADAGDEKAELILSAMALNIAKNIAKLAPVVCGKIDAVILTGGAAASQRLTADVAKRVEFIAPVSVLPGENEMQALASGAARVLRGTELAHKYVYRSV